MENIKRKIVANNEKLRALYEMEVTGGHFCITLRMFG